MEGRERKRRRRNLWSRKDSCGQWGKPPGGIATGPPQDLPQTSIVSGQLFTCYTDYTQTGSNGSLGRGQIAWRCYLRKVTLSLKLCILVYKTGILSDWLNYIVASKSLLLGKQPNSSMPRFLLVFKACWDLGPKEFSFCPLVRQDLKSPERASMSRERQ